MPAIGAPPSEAALVQPVADPEIGASILVGPGDFCTVQAGVQDGVPQYRVVFPLEKFDSPNDVEGDLVATAYRIEGGVNVVVHAPDGVKDTRSAVMALTRFIGVQHEPCSNPFRAVPTSVGLENLDIVTEDGVWDFRYNDPDN